MLENDESLGRGQGNGRPAAHGDARRPEPLTRPSPARSETDVDAEAEEERRRENARAVHRREFLRVMGASIALATGAGCTRQPPERIVPYVRAPEETVSPYQMWFATAFAREGRAIGVLAESHAGRPIKLEGNPKHPASVGRTDAQTQAAVLELYDPDRSQTVRHQGRISIWPNFLARLRRVLQDIAASDGRGLHVLTGAIASPTLASQLAELKTRFPAMRWHVHEPFAPENARAGARIAFGDAGNVDEILDFRQADVILALDADLFGRGPGAVRYAHDWAERRKPGEGARLNRLWAAEPTPTVTGSVADHRLPLAAHRVKDLAIAIAKGIGLEIGLESRAEWTRDEAMFIDALVEDLRTSGASSLIAAGEGQPPIVHALVHAMRARLESIGRTVHYLEPVDAYPADGVETLPALAEALAGGQVECLLILGGNPAFTAPADLGFADLISRARLSVHLSLFYDETSRRCEWHVPESHTLEMWSDARAFDGTSTIIQPLIAPLYASKSAHELIATVLETPQTGSYEAVRAHWQRWFREAGGIGDGGDADRGAARPGVPQDAENADGAAEATTGDDARDSNDPQRDEATGNAQADRSIAAEGSPPDAPGQAAEDGFEAFWRASVRAGVITETAAARVAPALAWDLRSPPEEREPEGAEANDGAANREIVEITFRPDPNILDGRFANNAWLQELPRPVTLLSWANAALVSPALAARASLETGDIVRLELEGRTIEIPVFIQPGQAESTVTLHAGYGRAAAGRIGDGVGVNVYPLRTSRSLWAARGGSIQKTGGRRRLVSTQDHFRMEGRDPVRRADLETYLANPSAVVGTGAEKHPQEQPSLYPEPFPEGYVEAGEPRHAWGMSIDLGTCIGCNACMIACQAENNISVVGEDQIARGREMYWIRVDRYYEGDLAQPEILFQPLPCMHCENAPCEAVCPTAASVHSTEGLNLMVYNRCIGTRYCANNCPYKVRYFNFYQYADLETPSLRLLRNPDVSVRSRGVMEKCTYCVQRINAARIQAKMDNRSIVDGEVKTACQQVCPAQAITFGDLADPNSRVSTLAREPRSYALLGALNTRPRTTYLARITNPHPRLKRQV